MLRDGYRFKAGKACLKVVDNETPPFHAIEYDRNTPSNVTVRWWFNYSQMMAFQDFYHNDALGGVLRVIMNLWVEDSFQTRYVRFVETPTYKQISLDYEVSATLEIEEDKLPP